MSKVLIVNEMPTRLNGAAARNQVRRLSGHGTTALQYAARRLAETLSGSIKGPKRVLLSFRQHPCIKAQREPLDAAQDRVGVL